MSKGHPYTLAGALLGWGAPFGMLVLRYVFSERFNILRWVTVEIQNHSLLYVYMTISTIVAFMIFGSWMDRGLWRIHRHIAALERSSEKLNELSMTDGLTGLYNHRYLQQRLEIEMQRSERYRIPLALLMIDIDDFKRLNDTYGHLFGDYALKHLSAILLQFTRKIDIVGRYGGEEFLLILPQTGEDMALRVAERIREGVASTSIKPEAVQSIYLSITIGVACLPRPDIHSSADAIQAADNALYLGKRNGKNRVELSRGLLTKDSII